MSIDNFSKSVIEFAGSFGRFCFEVTRLDKVYFGARRERAKRRKAYRQMMLTKHARMARWYRFSVEAARRFDESAIKLTPEEIDLFFGREYKDMTGDE